MMLCSFVGGKCKHCGRPQTGTKRTVAQCPGEAVRDWDRKPLQYLNCPHRGPVVATINGRVAGCGCSGSTVEVYRCLHFREPVLKQAAARCLEKIQAEAPGYKGLTCRECVIPQATASANR